MSAALESVVPDPLAQTRSRGFVSQLVAFGMVGGTGALAFVVLSNIFVGLDGGLPDWLASALCYAVLIGPVYLAHRRFSFSSEAPHAQALPRYVWVQLCSLLLATLFSYVSYSLLALPTVWDSLIVTGLTSGVSFMVLRLWAFAARGKSAGSRAPIVLADEPDVRTAG